MYRVKEEKILKRYLNALMKKSNGHNYTETEVSHVIIHFFVWFNALSFKSY